jgi:arylesterase/paraoxonase
VSSRTTSTLRIWLIRGALALLIVAILLSLVVVDFLRFGGWFSTLPAPTDQRCRSLALTASAEDIQIDRSRGLAYFSLLDRRGLISGNTGDGDISVLDLNDPEAVPVSALGSTPSGFRPHGMSLYPMGDGGYRLFVISHPPDDSHVIEVFEQAPSGGEFLPVASFSNPLFQSPNAIVATGPAQFYVVNDQGATHAFDRLREVAFRAGLSTLVYFDGTQMTDSEARVVATGLKSGVGLGISPDGRRVYVAETLGRRLAVFDRNAETGALNPTGHVSTPGSPDNIQVDASGSLWVAVHPKLLDLIRHFADPDHRSPSLILMYQGPSEIGSEEISTTHSRPLTDTSSVAHFNAGDLISAGSVGAVHDDMLLIGSITEPHVLQCTLQGVLQ